MYSVLPPPSSKFPPNGGIPIADTQNSIKRDHDPKDNLNLSEGLYRILDEIQLGTIPQHPTEFPSAPAHVLDPRPVALTSGPKVSLAVIAPRKTSPRIRRIPTANSGHSSISSEAVDTGGSGTNHSSSDVGANGNANILQPTTSRWRFGEGSKSMNGSAKEVKDNIKRKKPSKSIIKSNSSFISRVIQEEGRLKDLSKRDPSGMFAFVSTNRAFLWLDLATTERKHEALTKILFTKAHALCHDVNEHSKSINHLDVIMGSNQGDILWYEPFSGKYTRMNKNSGNGVINKNPVVAIRWLPGSENLFLAAHTDGTIFIYDKYRDDAEFKPEPQPEPGTRPQAKSRPRMITLKSVQSKAQSHNPVAAYKLSNEPINAFAISPTGTHLAAACEDGALRIIDLSREILTDLFQSYYGGLTCVEWSPDGEYILTGGQDDLVSIWSLSERNLVARGRGHKSWITDVAFDPDRCEDGNYRFASVGEDGRLLVWDFSGSMLGRPRMGSISGLSSRAPSATTVARVGTGSTTSGLAEGGLRSMHGVAAAQAALDGEEAESGADGPIEHPANPRAGVAMLPPIFGKLIENNQLTSVGFERDGIVVVTKTGKIRTYIRPAEKEER